VLLALCGCVVNKLLSDTISMYDASAISRFPAVCHVILKLLMSLMVIGGYGLGILSLRLFYVFQVVITGGVVLFLIISLRRDNRARFPEYISRGVREYLKEYYVYCRPLVVATVISQLVVMLMNYALMSFSGVTEQAMFGAAWQLNLLVSYVFSPYAELMKREFAVVAGDRQMLCDHFRQSVRMMLLVTGYFSVFLAVCAGWVLPIVYGEKYIGAVLVTQIIMYYTIYQAVGQVTGAYFIATERTRVQAVFTIVFQVLTLGAVFLFQIPNGIWPEGLGATGIALNYLTVNIINVVLMVGFIIREYGLSPIWENLAGIPVIAALTGAALIFRELFSLIPGEGIVMIFIRVILTGICYTAATGLIIWLFPGLTLGATREAIRAKLARIRKVD
ncbi:MAG: hypothetical protein J6N76_03165, partial [Lachnospiraceae bacterium]|nr:hypothetical protein [Lachnospiraceae bacterium]